MGRLRTVCGNRNQLQNFRTPVLSRQRRNNWRRDTVSEGSFCPVYRTMRVLKALSNLSAYKGLWAYVLETSATLSADEESAVTRIMDFVEASGLFQWVSYLRRVTIAKGIFVANLNDFNDHGLPLSQQRVVTTFTCTVSPTPTTSVCPSVTIDYINAIPSYSEVVVSTHGFGWYSWVDLFEICPAQNACQIALETSVDPENVIRQVQKRPSILCWTLTFPKDLPRLFLRGELAICISRGNGEPVNLVWVGGRIYAGAKYTCLYTRVSGSKGLYRYIMYMRRKDILPFTKQYRRSRK